MNNFRKLWEKQQQKSSLRYFLSMQTWLNVTELRLLLRRKKLPEIVVDSNSALSTSNRDAQAESCEVSIYFQIVTTKGYQELLSIAYRKLENDEGSQSKD